jgi:hypothetical protein
MASSNPIATSQVSKNNWLLTGTPTAAVMAMALLLSPANKLLTAIGVGITSAVSSVGAISVINRRRDMELEIIKEQFSRVSNAQKLEAELPLLQANFQNLQSERSNIEKLIKQKENEISDRKEQLGYITGQFAEIQGKETEIKQEVAILSEKKEDIERRITQIERQNPDLEIRENLQLEIEKSRLEKSALEGQKEAIQTQIKILEPTKTSLEQIKIELGAKQAELEQIDSQLKYSYSQKEQLENKITELKQSQVNQENQLAQQQAKSIDVNEGLQQKQKALSNLQEELTVSKQEYKELQESIHQNRLERRELEQQLSVLPSQIENYNAEIHELKIRKQELEKLTTELELLRVTYDALFTERQSFEERVKQLRPEIEGLEFQKQQILQAIETNEKEYLKIEQKREESRRLTLEIKERQAEINRLEREARKLEGFIAGRQEENAQLQQENANLEKKLKQIKGEINEVENSAAIALQSLRNKLWKNLPAATINIDPTPTGEQNFLEKFSQFLQSKGLSFPDRVIRAFHTSLKVQDISALAILAGISGTGKSELPQRYADYIGAQMLNLAVQPRWDSPQDLQGFYNYIEKKYKPTDLMRGLYQYQNDTQMRDRLVIVLLDEMNLARVEYYFSDFLSKLETRRSNATYLDLDVGSLPLPEEQRRLLIPHQFLFVGTMNEDETTQSLSDKVLDRANVLTFGKPQALKLREEYRQNGNSLQSLDGYISYSQFKNWMRKSDPNSEVVQKVCDRLDDANKIMEKLGHPFAHRVYQAIIAYVVNYPGVIEGNKEALQAALADQFGQKLLPKLRGLMIDECHEELEEFSRLIKAIDDRSLEQAFEQAKEGRYGQFQWRGFVYQNERELASI